MHEALPGVIGSHSKLDLEGFKSHILGCLGQHLVSGMQKGAPCVMIFAIATPLGRFGAQIWIQFDFEGPIRLVFVKVFGAVEKREKHVLLYHYTVQIGK